MIPGNWGMGFCGFGISTLYYVLLLVHDLHWISHDWESGNSLGTGTSLLCRIRLGNSLGTGTSCFTEPDSEYSQVLGACRLPGACS